MPRPSFATTRTGYITDEDIIEQLKNEPYMGTNKLRKIFKQNIGVSHSHTYKHPHMSHKKMKYASKSRHLKVQKTDNTPQVNNPAVPYYPTDDNMRITSTLTPHYEYESPNAHETDTEPASDTEKGGIRPKRQQLSPRTLGGSSRSKTTTYVIYNNTKRKVYIDDNKKKYIKYKKNNIYLSSIKGSYKIDHSNN
jgi:hypothetical protein